MDTPDTTDERLTLMIDHIKNRKAGVDAMLEHRRMAQLNVSVTRVTKVEIFQKEAVADSGSHEVVAKYFTERDAYLITVKNWNNVGDKETCLRTQIIPLLSDRFKLSPKAHTLFQFLDHDGHEMRHEPSPVPKVLPPPGWSR